jgi:hypothetical protein
MHYDRHPKYNQFSVDAYDDLGDIKERIYLFSNNESESRGLDNVNYEPKRSTTLTQQNTKPSKNNTKAQTNG